MTQTRAPASPTRRPSDLMSAIISAQMELAILRNYPHDYIIKLVHTYRAQTGHELLFLEYMGGGSLEDIMDNRSEEHTSELQSRFDLVCRLLLEKKKQNKK